MQRNLVLLLLLATPVAGQGGPGLPPVPSPPENPITQQKAVLGKILFWDEQLSSDDTMACGTCHLPSAGGGDPVLARHPGFDHVFNTADDGRTSRGVVHSDSNFAFDPAADFDLDRQATRRSAPSTFGSLFSRSQFWDGRGLDTFTDPLTGRVVIPRGGSLESQALKPLLSTAEMAAEGRTWQDVTSKLANARPLVLATNLPADVATALRGVNDYPELFRRTFGTPDVTPVRIAFAIATYERTLVPDQTPFDTGRMTPQQAQGFQAFRTSRCDVCHRPPFFSDDTFRRLGVRPQNEDTGREEVTADVADRARFKVPGLRNTSLRSSWMHNGRFTSLRQVLDFYGKRTANFPPIDQAFLDVRVPPQAVPLIEEFLRGGLTDPRVAAGTFPFDRPSLRSERPLNSQHGTAVAGGGGVVPRLLDHQPAFVGAESFRIGIRDGRPGATALLALSPATRSYSGLPIPVAIDLDQTVILGLRLTADGCATAQLPIPAVPALTGGTLQAQGFVTDPAAPYSLAVSRASAFPITN